MCVLCWSNLWASRLGRYRYSKSSLVQQTFLVDAHNIFATYRQIFVGILHAQNYFNWFVDVCRTVCTLSMRIQCSFVFKPIVRIEQFQSNNNWQSVFNNSGKSRRHTASWAAIVVLQSELIIINSTTAIFAFSANCSIRRRFSFKSIAHNTRS